MKYIQPIYFDRFKCLASDCPDTCCSAWNIDIDDDTLDFYEAYEGPFAPKLHASIDWEDGTFFQNNHYCMLLDENHLCSVFNEIGEHAMCETCKTYPRHIEEYKDVAEYSLSLSCPEAARLILSTTDHQFLYSEDDYEEPFEEFDEEMFLQLNECRYMICDMILRAHFDLDYTISCILDMAKDMDRQNCEDKLQVPGILYTTGTDHELYKLYDHQKFKDEFHIFYELDTQRPDWELILQDTWTYLIDIDENTYSTYQNNFRSYIATHESLQWKLSFCNLLIYFLYVYLNGAVYDNRIYAKVSFAVFSVIWLKNFMFARWIKNGCELSFDEMLEIAYKYAREVEHSDINLDILEDFCETI